MRCKLLTETSSKKKVDGRGRERLVSIYKWRDRDIEVCDSARNVLSAIRLLDGKDAPPEEVNERLIDAIFFDFKSLPIDPEEEFEGLLYDVMWDVCGIDVTPDVRFADEDQEPWFDWDEDADRIRNSLRAAYGISWDDVADTMTFSEASSLITQLAEYGVDTPFQQAVHYRLAKPPSAKKFGQEYVDDFNDRRDFYELKGANISAYIDAQNAGVDAMFEVS